MVRSVTPDDDCKILEKEIKAKRFAYTKDNVKRNPWAKLEADNNNNNNNSSATNLFNLHSSSSSGSEYPKPSDFKGRTFHSYQNFSRAFNNTTHDEDAFSKSIHKKGSSNSNVLDKNWSIKNVPFSFDSSQQSACISPPAKLPTNASSLYSRYKLGNTRPSPLASNGNSLTSVTSQQNMHQRTWTTKQSNFSYAAMNTSSQSDGNDADDEFDHSSSSLTNLMKGSMGHCRPVSGRTKKAGKLHDAYLKSRGMGSYATGASGGGSNKVCKKKSVDKENDCDDETDSNNEFT